MSSSLIHHALRLKSSRNCPWPRNHAGRPVSEVYDPRWLRSQPAKDRTMSYTFSSSFQPSAVRWRCPSFFQLPGQHTRLLRGFFSPVRIHPELGCRGMWVQLQSRRVDESERALVHLRGRVSYEYVAARHSCGSMYFQRIFCSVLPG